MPSLPDRPIAIRARRGARASIRPLGPRERIPARTPGGTRGTIRVHERLPAHPDNVARLRRRVLGFAAHHGASFRRREDIALAVSEALTNAVVHAYRDHDRPGRVEIEASLSDGALVVVVRDEGMGLVPRDDSPGLGLGLGLMRQASDAIVFDDARPGLSVRMTFALS